MDGTQLVPTRGGHFKLVSISLVSVLTQRKWLSFLMVFGAISVFVEFNFKI